MLTTVLGNLSDLANALLNAMSGIVVLWPVAIMAAFLILGVGTGYIKKLAGARRSRRRRG